jgi:hypothetical protein
MKQIGFWLTSFVIFFLNASAVMAQAPNPEIVNYTNSTLHLITIIASIAAVLFLIKGGYGYITSAGNPENLEEAKRTIKNALTGLVLVLGSTVLINVFQGALVAPSTNTPGPALSLAPIGQTTPNGGLTQVMIDAVNGLLQNLVESATKPIIDGLFSFLTNSPSLLSNSTVFNFWLISVGIVDSLFILVVAILGLHIMSAATFGFEELELKELLPKLGLAFLGANISLFLCDYALETCNTLINVVLKATGGLNHSFVTNALNFETITTNSLPLIILVFFLILLIVSVVLLLLYISRLIVISLGAVLSPFIFLLWVIPKYADLADIAVKSYLVTIFSLFIHVVTIQLASAFLSFPDNSQNSLLSLAVAIGLFTTLLKTPSIMFSLVMYTSRTGTVKKIGGQLMNVLTTNRHSSLTRQAKSYFLPIKTPRRRVNI